MPVITVHYCYHSQSATEIQLLFWWRFQRIIRAMWFVTESLIEYAMYDYVQEKVTTLKSPVRNWVLERKWVRVTHKWVSS